MPGGPGGPLGAAQSSAVMHTREGTKYHQCLQRHLTIAIQPQHHIESSFMTAQTDALVAHASETLLRRAQPGEQSTSEGCLQRVVIAVPNSAGYYPNILSSRR